MDLNNSSDTVDQIFFTKLENVGVHEQTCGQEWFRSYLSNRSQAVVINEVLSEQEKNRSLL